MADAPSIRSLAAGLNLSRATVSEALRGSPRVKEETRRRVVAEAERTGYRLDPVASELMARMRRSVSNAFRGAIALVLPEEANASPAALRRRSILRRAADERATELGFKLDPVSVGSGSWPRLLAMLHARGVVGALILPFVECRPEHRALFAGADFQAVYADAPEEGAEHVDAVAPDYRQALSLARTRLAAMGYRRPGLVLSGAEKAAEALCWRAAWETFSAASERAAPPLVLERGPVQELALERWRHEHGVDMFLMSEPVAVGCGGPGGGRGGGGVAGGPAGGGRRGGGGGSRAVEVLARGYFDRMRGRRWSPALLSLPARWRPPAAARPVSAEPGAGALTSRSPLVVEDARLAAMAV